MYLGVLILLFDILNSNGIVYYVIVWTICTREIMCRPCMTTLLYDILLFSSNYTYDDHHAQTVHDFNLLALLGPCFLLCTLKSGEFASKYVLRRGSNQLSR